MVYFDDNEVQGEKVEKPKRWYLKPLKVICFFTWLFAICFAVLAPFTADWRYVAAAIVIAIVSVAYLKEIGNWCLSFMWEDDK